MRLRKVHRYGFKRDLRGTKLARTGDRNRHRAACGAWIYNVGSGYHSSAVLARTDEQWCWLPIEMQCERCDAIRPAPHAKHGDHLTVEHMTGIEVMLGELLRLGNAMRSAERGHECHHDFTDPRGYDGCFCGAPPSLLHVPWMNREMHWQITMAVQAVPNCHSIFGVRWDWSSVGTFDPTRVRMSVFAEDVIWEGDSAP